MLRNVPHIKKNVASKQVKHLLNVNSLDIIWSSFLFLTLKKLLRKPVLVIKSLFYLFWHWFITLSYKLQDVSSYGSDHSSIFLQSSRWKWQEASIRAFFKLSKKNIPCGCFQNLAIFCKSFLGVNKGRKATTLQETQSDQIF